MLTEIVIGAAHPLAGGGKAIGQDRVMVFLVCGYGPYLCPDPAEDGKWQEPGRVLLSHAPQGEPVNSPEISGNVVAILTDDLKCDWDNRYDVLVVTNENRPETGQEENFNLFLFESKSPDIHGLNYVCGHSENLKRAEFVASRIPDLEHPGEFVTAEIIDAAIGDIDGDYRNEIIIAMNPSEVSDYRSSIVTYDIADVIGSPGEPPTFALNEIMENYSFLIEDHRLVDINIGHYYPSTSPDMHEDLMLGLIPDPDAPPSSIQDVRFYYSNPYPSPTPSPSPTITPTATVTHSPSCAFVMLPNASIKLSDLGDYIPGDQTTRIDSGSIFVENPVHDFIIGTKYNVYFLKNNNLDLSPPQEIHCENVNEEVLDIEVARFFFPIQDPLYDVFIMTGEDDPAEYNLFEFAGKSGNVQLKYSTFIPLSPNCFEIGELNFTDGELPYDMVVGHTDPVSGAGCPNPGYPRFPANIHLGDFNESENNYFIPAVVHDELTCPIYGPIRDIAIVQNHYQSSHPGVGSGGSLAAEAPRQRPPEHFKLPANSHNSSAHMSSD